MKPVKLSMTAFGSYAETHIIDFEPLNDRSFFLIHGPTGAGKTTILDAMCFALYGETSGNERKCEQMRSHHADPSVPTEVTFEFALGEKYYRISRSIKLYKVDENSKEILCKPDKATLWQMLSITSEQGEFKVLAAKWKMVTELIENILGFNSDQFRQVILLPQDQFLKLLKASSQDREEIFKTLFQTEQYERIEKALKDEAKKLADLLKELKSRIEFILTTAQVSTAKELSQKRKGILQNLSAARNKLSSLRVLEKQAAEKLAEGIDTQNKINERKQAEVNLRVIKFRNTEISEKRKKLKRAQRTIELLDLENTTMRRKIEADELQSKSEYAFNQLTRTQAQQQLAEEKLEFELKRDEERSKARNECDQLEIIAGYAQKLEIAQKDFNKIQQQATLAQEKRNKAYQIQENLRKELNRVELELTKIETSTKNLFMTKRAKEEAQAGQDKWLNLLEIARKLKAVQQKEEEALGRSKEIALRLIKARERRDHIEEIWHAGQASILAKQLVENTPCPVCGSTEHPHPAISELIPPSEGELNKAKSDVTDFERQNQTIQSECSQLHEEIVRLNAERKPLLDDLKEKANWTKSQIEAEVKLAQIEYQRAESEDKRLDSMKQKLDPAKKQLAEAEIEYLRLEGEWQETSKKHTSSKAILSEREHVVPPELRNKENLHLEVKNASEKVLQLEKALEDAQKNDQKAQQQLVAANATYKEIFEQASNAKQLAEGINKDFQSRIENVGFVNVEDYRSAKLPRLGINSLDSEIREYEGQLSAARERLVRATEQAKSLLEPDISKLLENENSARVDVESTLKKVHQLESEEDIYKGHIRQLTQIQKEFDRNDNLYRVIGKIAEVANGRNAYNLTFQRFVLSALLDDVLNDATQRMNIMSRGRYILQRAQSPLDKRRGSGLDLIVSDTWTGESKRPVETLSGGEGFYASLALALGLAEVVQRYAGGIRLDTIFIDEGFGSLDSDTLDLAIRTLEGLRENGRLVGIISHVESLRERIPTRLEVTPSIKGSTIRFMIG
jgi:exonuclease SbcC